MRRGEALGGDVVRGARVGVSHGAARGALGQREDEGAKEGGVRTEASVVKNPLCAPHLRGVAQRPQEALRGRNKGNAPGLKEN